MRLAVRSLLVADRDGLAEILRDTPQFSPEESACALEMIDSCLNDPARGEYEHVVATDDGDRPVGYACFGPTSLTAGTYDLYWIAVRFQEQRLGVGSSLLERVECDVEQAGGRMLLIQTSGRPDYAAARAFYAKNGYVEVARIEDYYAVGDDIVICRKRF